MKRIIAALMFVMMSAGLSWSYGGNGTKADPYIIYTISDYHALKSELDGGEEKYYVLSCDLQLTSYSELIAPIYTGVDIVVRYKIVLSGDELVRVPYTIASIDVTGEPFTGHFDGQGHNVYVKIKPDPLETEDVIYYMNCALFGEIATPESDDPSADYAVKNLNVGGEIIGLMGAGITSKLSSGRIINCTSSCDIITEPQADIEDLELHMIHAGGIVADMNGGEIISCDFSGNITTSGGEFFSYAGGLVGAMAAGHITGCTVKHYSVITAEGNSDSERSQAAGGIAGFLEVDDLYANDSLDVTVTGCTFEGGEITGGSNAGGIIGIAYGGLIADNTVGDDARISAGISAGGIVGQMGAGSAVLSNDVMGGYIRAASRAAGGIAGLLELGETRDNYSRAAVRGDAPYKGGIIGEIHNHYGTTGNISGNTYSGAAYGIGIDEHGMRNMDSGCEKDESNLFWFISTSVLDEALEMTKYKAEIEMNTPITIDLSTIPSWMTPVLNGAVIYLSGIPTNPGTESFTLTANYGEHSVSKTYRITVRPQLSVNITGHEDGRITSTPGAEVNISPQLVSVSADLTQAAITWSVLSGDFPEGLSMDASTGKITGRVLISGDYEFTIQAAPENVSLAPASKTLTLSVAGTSFTVRILTDTLPDAIIGTQYSFALSYDAPSIFTPSWAITAGGLPYGLSLDASAGTISGIPLYGSYYEDFTSEFTVQLTAGLAVSKYFTLNVLSMDASADTPAESETDKPSVIISQKTLPDGIIGQSYHAVLDSIPVGSSWSHSGGIIPPGLVLSSDGVISGVPSTIGDFWFNATASHTSYDSSSMEYAIHVSYPDKSGEGVQSSGGGGGGCSNGGFLWLMLTALCFWKKVINPSL